MKVKVSEVKYLSESSVHPTDFMFDVEEEIYNDDNKLSVEVYKLIREQTGEELVECTIDID